VAHEKNSVLVLDRRPPCPVYDVLRSSFRNKVIKTGLMLSAKYDTVFFYLESTNYTNIITKTFAISDIFLLTESINFLGDANHIYIPLRC
jgi:hypothetical protein